MFAVFLAQMLFSQIQQAHVAKTSERWETLVTASSTGRQRSESIVRAQRIANENFVGTQ